MPDRRSRTRTGQAPASENGLRQLRWALPLALYAVFLWRTPYGMKSLPLRMLDWIIPAVGLGVWCIRNGRRGRPWPRTALDWPLLAWLVTLLWATAFSIDLRQSLRGAWEMWTWALILWLLVDALRQGWGPVFWRALYLVGGVVCLIGALEFLSWYFGWPLLPSFQQGWFAIGGLSQPWPPTVYRLGFTLVHATVLSAFVALLIPPALCILLATQDREVRWGMLLWLIAACLIQLLSLSRGGLLALAISVPFVLLGSTRSPGFRSLRTTLSRGKTRALLAGALVLFVGSGVVGGTLVVTRLVSHQSGDMVRWDLWRSATDMLTDHPLTGVGVAAYGIALRQYRNPLLAREGIGSAHSLYLNTAAETGWPGLLAGTWLLAALAWIWWRRWRSETPGTPPWWRLLGVGGALAGLIVQSSAETFTEPAILLPAGFFAAYVVAHDCSRPAIGKRPRRWPWILPVVSLALGALVWAWDDAGYARFWRGLKPTARGDLDVALSAVKRAQELDPGMSLYACHAGYLYGLQASEGDDDALRRALEQYDECVKDVPIPGWLDQLNQAALLWQAGQTASARNRVEEVTTHTPLEWMPWLNRGLWAEMEGDLQEAAISYGWTWALNPGLAGSPFWQENRAVGWEAVLAAGEQVMIELGWPEHAWRWQVLVAVGQFETAAQETQSWLQAHPEDAEAMAWLGEALLGRGRPTEARAWLDRAQRRAPARARTYIVRGEAAMTLGHYDAAAQDFRTALFLQPDPVTHLALARWAQRTGTVDAALQEYGLALRPLTVSQYSGLVLYHRIGWSGLLPQVARIGYRHDAEAALEWGALMEQRGDLETAQLIYRAALILDQSLGTVRQRLPADERP